MSLALFRLVFALFCRRLYEADIKKGLSMRYLTAIAVALLCASWAGAHPPKAYVVAPPAPKKACACGDACVCKPGACPGSCPVATRPDLMTTTGQTIRWTGTAYVFVGSTPSVSGCVNGQCPLPRR